MRLLKANRIINQWLTRWNYLYRHQMPVFTNPLLHWYEVRPTNISLPDRNSKKNTFAPRICHGNIGSCIQSTTRNRAKSWPLKGIPTSQKKDTLLVKEYNKNISSNQGLIRFGFVLIQSRFFKGLLYYLNQYTFVYLWDTKWLPNAMVN